LCRVGPALRAEATAQAQRSCRAGPGTARQTQPIWPSIPLHDNDGSRLSCRHLVRHPASFLSPLMPPLPHHSILGRGCGSKRLLPYLSDTSPDTDPRSGYCTSTRTFHSMRAPSSDVPFVFSAFAIVGCLIRLLGLRLVLPPQPTAIAHGRSREPTDLF
jgi:hypothetical protein